MPKNEYKKFFGKRKRLQGDEESPKISNSPHFRPKMTHSYPFRSLTVKSKVDNFFPLKAGLRGNKNGQTLFFSLLSVNTVYGYLCVRNAVSP